jgi:hypothetical protein
MHTYLIVFFSICAAPVFSQQFVTLNPGQFAILIESIGGQTFIYDSYVDYFDSATITECLTDSSVVVNNVSVSYETPQPNIIVPGVHISSSSCDESAGKPSSIASYYPSYIGDADESQSYFTTFLAFVAEKQLCLQKATGRVFAVSFPPTELTRDGDFLKGRAKVLFTSQEVPANQHSTRPLNIDQAIASFYNQIFESSDFSSCTGNQRKILYDPAVYNDNHVESYAQWSGPNCELTPSQGSKPFNYLKCFLNDLEQQPIATTINSASYLTVFAYTITRKMVARTYKNAGLQFEATGGTVETIRPTVNIKPIEFGFENSHWNGDELAIPFLVAFHNEYRTTTPWASFGKYLSLCVDDIQPYNCEELTSIAGQYIYKQSAHYDICGIQSSTPTGVCELKQRKCVGCYLKDGDTYTANSINSKNFSPFSLGFLRRDLFAAGEKFVIAGQNNQHHYAAGPAIYSLLGSTSTTGGYRVNSDTSDTNDVETIVTAWYPISLANSFQSIIDDVKTIYLQFEDFWTTFQDVLGKLGEIETFFNSIGKFL